MKAISTIKIGAPPAPAFYRFNLRPQPKERAQSIFRNGKHRVMTSEKTRRYEDQIEAAAALQHPALGPWEGDLVVYLNFYFHSRVHGDLDNLAKAILDGIQSRRIKKGVKSGGVVMKDDKQVKGLTLFFHYISKDETERTEMIVDRYKEDIPLGITGYEGVEFEVDEEGEVHGST